VLEIGKSLFKYRNKLGTDVAIEALKDALLNKRSTVDELLKYSDICRVHQIITPYMESFCNQIEKLTF